MLNGYKTYIAAVVIAIATGLQVAGIIDDTIYQAVLGVLTSLGLIAARVGAVKG